jgi:hypothetical protein
LNSGLKAKSRFFAVLGFFGFLHVVALAGTSCPGEGQGFIDLFFIELGINDFLIDRARRKELLMGSASDDLAIFQDNDVIRVDDGRNTLSDDDDRSVFGVAFERFSELDVGFEIEGGERIIEDIDLRLSSPRLERWKGVVFGLRRSSSRLVRPHD